jgi:hypothetical protein
MENIMTNLKSDDTCCSDTGAKKPMFRKPVYIVLGVAALVAVGLFYKWPAIVALGIAPLVLMMASCTLMCAVGLCKTPTTKDKGIALKPPQDTTS